MNKETEMYPVIYNGKSYEREDCYPLFNDLYMDKDSLLDGGVYLTDGIYIYPDGSTDDY